MTRFLRPECRIRHRQLYHFSFCKRRLLDMQVGVGIVHPATAVRDLGVLLDSDLTNHISNVTSICFCQLRRLHQVSHLVRLEVTAQRVSSFMLSRPDYCNSVLHRHTLTSAQSRRTTQTVRPRHTVAEAATLAAH